MNKLKALFKKYENSIVGYLPVKIVEGVVMMLMLKIYVNIFSQEQYGYYSVYNKTVNVMYLMVIGWIGMASFRYIKAYMDNDSEKERFYSTVFFSYVTLMLAIVLMALLVFSLAPHMVVGGYKTYFAMMVLLLGYGLNQLFITLLIYQNKQRLNMLLVLLASPLKLGLTYVFYRLSDGQMISILLSHGLIDIVLASIAINRLEVFNYISIKQIDKTIIKEFIGYGYPLIGLSLVMFLLNSSDQYVIIGYDGPESNAVYAANYSVAASIFTMITMGMNRGVYPKALGFWQQGDEINAKRTVSQGFKFFLLIATASATGLMLVSESISTLFLETNYAEGHIVIGVIAFSMVFYGMSEYMNKGYELRGYTVPIFIHCLIAATVNVLLNLVLVPRFGYQAAAYTTLIGFITYFLLSYIRRDKGFIWSLPVIDMVKIVIASLTMYLVATVIKGYLNTSIWSLLVVMCVSVVVYAVMIYVLGVLKEEIKEIKSKRG